MFCRCAVRIRNFHFAPWGYMRVKQWSFLIYKVCHSISIYSPCRCPLRFKKLNLAPRRNKHFFNQISITWNSLIFLFCYYSPWRKIWPFMYNTWTPLPMDTLYQVRLKLPKWSLSRIYIKIVNVILYMAFISSWKNKWPLNWTNLNSFYPSILCVMFGWNWPHVSGEDFQKLSMYFQFVAINSP